MAIYYIDRRSNKKVKEAVYGQKWLSLLYQDHPLFKYLCKWVARLTFLSALYGWWQKQSWTKKKIKPFIDHYHVNDSEFLKPIKEFTSFNDFFCRKLKKSARPICSDLNRLSAPADGRYLVIPQIAQAEGFFVKGKKFTLQSLLKDQALANAYQEGSMVIARLCPTDYHRFHFPADCSASKAQHLDKMLWSVNPIAVKQNISIFTENKRVITTLTTDTFGEVLFIEVGATNVGTIHQTYKPNQPNKKGDEKGFFSFGGSSLILLFKQNSIIFDQDLITNSSQYIETLCLMGEGIGSIKK